MMAPGSAESRNVETYNKALYELDKIDCFPRCFEPPPYSGPVGVDVGTMRQEMDAKIATERTRVNKELTQWGAQIVAAIKAATPEAAAAMRAEINTLKATVENQEKRIAQLESVRD